MSKQRKRMHPALADQAVFDVMVNLYSVIIRLAGEANDAHRRRREMTVRALRAEAVVQGMRAERDYWRALVFHKRSQQRESAKRRRAA